jgi:hypothetical protein
MDGPFHDRVGLQQPDGNQFVALSINLKRILQGAGLPGRGRGGDRAAAGRAGRRGVAAAWCRRGLYRFAPGVLLCLLVAVLDAWVLLVEILR